ncbi:MAG: prolyl oligopeptidase family serine peptidase [Rhodothermales bacterium]
MNARTTACLFAVLLAVVGCDAVPPDATIRIKGYDYFVFLPRQYESRDAWPLILFLHGAGQHVETQEETTLYTAVPKYAVEHDDFPFIVIAPQSPPPDTWINERLADLLDEVEATLRVDEDRIYVTGLSMGGFGTFLVTTAYPDRFAAVVPIAGGGRPEEACRMKDVPTWVFHNAGDRIVPVSQSQAMVDALQACNGDVRFTLYDRSGHDAWSRTYSTPELYDWFLSHRLSDRP